MNNLAKIVKYREYSINNCGKWFFSNKFSPEKYVEIILRCRNSIFTFEYIDIIGRFDGLNYSIDLNITKTGYIVSNDDDIPHIFDRMIVNCEKWMYFNQGD